MDRYPAQTVDALLGRELHSVTGLCTGADSSSDVQLKFSAYVKAPNPFAPAVTEDPTVHLA